MVPSINLTRMPLESMAHSQENANEDNIVSAPSTLSLLRCHEAARLPLQLRKRILVTGGAGFIGSHLVDRLMMDGHEVLVMDNYYTGRKGNLAHWHGHPRFEQVRHDVIEPFMAEIDQIYHLACPASPPHYQSNQVKTIKTNFMGTINMLGLAKRTGARFLLASTSEVYGDPEISPQPESYRGNVSCNGPRACYDEGKRVSESLTYGYLQQDDVDVRVARIFNTYGPRMHPEDGRVVSNFVMQALRGEPLTIYGEGNQTRSFCFVSDLVDGLIRLMNSEPKNGFTGKGPAALDASGQPELDDVFGPVNLGNPVEFTMLELAKEVTEIIREMREAGKIPPLSSIKKLTNTETDEKANIVFMPLPIDDPRQRRPDIGRANYLLKWGELHTVYLFI